MPSITRSLLASSRDISDNPALVFGCELTIEYSIINRKLSIIHFIPNPTKVLA
ncbi:hypothetical protein D1BOALGB6SA_3105 [Olavius sp. associated proteobacterium Delta 1]|nr:hypothetical protein D1BOALGB6SA_3105 [Olavius sp. associated proteobacterium Delta 1]